ncbi:MAG: hypothetical protein ACJAXA_000410 [Candidatus Aldehydirespiratoraceae bacterium]|jgi:hypothetical protein
MTSTDVHPSDRRPAHGVVQSEPVRLEQEIPAMQLAIDPPQPPRRPAPIY